MINIYKKIISFLNFKNDSKNENQLLAIGSLLSKQIVNINSKNINDYEFKIFSQWGDDGIIQYLIQNLQITNKTFIEFGVENFLESNTRFLMMNNNWEGFVMDGSKDSVSSIKSQNWFWQYNINAIAVFINRDNINMLLKESGFENVGLLHIDLDGNDYHIFEVIDLTKINPSIIIIEYNSIFGNSRSITVPYDENFYRTEKHYSNLYWGASLPSLCYLAKSKGYALVGCNNAGNNAYFVRKDLLNNIISEVSHELAFKESKYRESRDLHGNLTYISGKNRISQICGLDVLNVLNNNIEKL
jgi:hypothetical protein